MENNIIQDKMDNKEVNCNVVKKVWVTPELEVLDGRETFCGWDASFDESIDRTAGPADCS